VPPEETASAFAILKPAAAVFTFNDYVTAGIKIEVKPKPCEPPYLPSRASLPVLPAGTFVDVRPLGRPGQDLGVA